MSEEKNWTGERVGPYQIGERIKTEGPGIGGFLHLAHDVHTGARALLLLPDGRTEWRFKGSWQVNISGQRDPSSVTMDVERASKPFQLKEVGDALRLITAAVVNAEDKARLNAHLMGKPVGVLERWWGRARTSSRSGWVRAAVVGFAVLAVGLGFWRYEVNPDPRLAEGEAPVLEEEVP
jgi:hypothetical protein